jgi:solute carrier family 25 carnitine/acylcarnitine transporter 20/29
MISSINFTLYEKTRRLIATDNNISDLGIIFMAGTIAGTFISVLTTPIGLIKVQQQTISNTGVISCFQQIYGKHGIRGLYRGFGPMIIMESYGRGVYLWTYEFVKSRLGNNGNELLIWHRIVAAASAGMFSWLVVYPLDVIKSKVQTDISRQLYKSSWDCCKQTWKEGGINALTRGIGFTLLRAAPVASVVLPIYEYSYKILQNNGL